MIPIDPSLSRPKVTAGLPDGSPTMKPALVSSVEETSAVLTAGKYLVCVESHKFSSVIYDNPVIDADVGRIDKQLG